MKGYNLFNCGANDAGRRLDRVVKKMLPDVPAGLIYSGIRKGLIRVNEKKSKQSYRLSEGDIIAVKQSVTYSLHNAPPKDPPAQDGAASRAKLERITVLRTENLLIVNKPAGMLTHGDNSLAGLVESGVQGVESSLSFKPAPLHRLDRNTSGLITVSLTIAGAARFSELMRGRQLDKYYLGICLGGPKAEQRLEDSLERSGYKSGVANPSPPVGPPSVAPAPDARGAKRAVTTVRPLARGEGCSLCLFKIETGVTHQIRAQASAAGYPLAGDAKYGGALRGFRTFFLHALSLSLHDFDETCGFKSCTADVPPAFMKKAGYLFGTEEAARAIETVKAEISQ